MIHSLKHFGDPPDGRTNTMSDILSVLTLSGGADLDEWGRAKWKPLTVEQSGVICRYLRFVAAFHWDKYNVRDALKGVQQHWGQFCG
jgi:hypothetical protein